MDFTRKARFVAEGRHIEPPASATYACLVSKDGVHVLLIVESLNDIYILSVVIQVVYINQNFK